VPPSLGMVFSSTTDRPALAVAGLRGSIAARAPLPQIRELYRGEGAAPTDKGALSRRGRRSYK
jgi:hypothetical protein